jgi:uncharacterized membrane protein
VTQTNLAWQSKLVLIAVLPATVIEVFLRTQWWAVQLPSVAVWVLGLSGILGLITWQLRAATPAAAVAGTIITADLIYSTLEFPYQPWHTALVPVLLVSLLAFAATRAGRKKKMRLGTAEKNTGRAAAQIAANLGAAALVAGELVQFWLEDTHRLPRLRPEQAPLFIAALAARLKPRPTPSRPNLARFLVAAPA